jgi:hypothetical protein
MTRTQTIISTTAVGLSLLSFSVAGAVSIPVGNIEIIAKRLTDSKISIIRTDATGAFTIFDSGNNPYYLWLQNEDAPPTKVSSVDGKISGKLVFVVDDPLPVKKVPVKKPAVKAPIKPAAIIKR